MLKSAAALDVASAPSGMLTKHDVAQIEIGGPASAHCRSADIATASRNRKMVHVNSLTIRS